MSSPAPRLHAILAREAPTAVVIRRGPAKRVCTVGWDRRDDSFSLGQWVAGRIYERRCDLSPDGRHFIYFTMKGFMQAGDEIGVFTAIARAPWLRALALWPQEETWGGGGAFLDDCRFWLNEGYEELQPHFDESGLGRVRATPEGFGGIGECPSIYVPRLLRDGWREVDDAGTDAGVREPIVHVVKELPGGWRLLKVFGSKYRAGWDPCSDDDGDGREDPGPVYREGHALLRPDGQRIDGSDWEWADWDAVRDRVVFARAGKLFAADLAERPFEPAELFDFATLVYSRKRRPVPYQGGRPKA